MFFDECGKLHKQDAGLNGDGEVFRVKFKYLVHKGGFYHNSAVYRDARADKPRARAADNDGDIAFVRVFHYF